MGLFFYEISFDEKLFYYPILKNRVSKKRADDFQTHDQYKSYNKRKKKIMKKKKARQQSFLSFVIFFVIRFIDWWLVIK